MKRAALVWLVLAGMAVPSFAVKRVTVAQLEQLVTTLQGKPDVETAFRIADVALTERLAATRIARLSAALAGGKSRQALTAIADASEFQPPPPDEIPATAPPDLATQRRIMGLAANYVSKTIPQLPNLMATRETDFFEDTPLLQRPADSSIPYQPLHLVGHSSAAVFYREGREVAEPSRRARQAEAGRGLRTYGQFGPILALILLDAARNNLAFSRWEQPGPDLQAVFSYRVPREKSHYYVDYCCIANEAATEVANNSPFHEIVAYHGEMAVDPDRGSILRLSVVAELKAGSPVTRADILVDYGPVEIGGKTYLCPVKGVSITTAQMVQLAPDLGYPLARQLQPLRTMLNEVRFEQYHVFRSESRVLTAGNGDAPSAPPASIYAPENARAAIQASPVTAPSATTWENPFSGSASPSELVSTSPDRLAPPPPATTPRPEPPEISFTETTMVPETSAQIPINPTASAFTLRSITRLVDVGLVAFDKKGYPVTGLTQGDFELYDNGRRQEIKYFGQASTVVAPTPAAQRTQPGGVPPEPIYSNRQTAPALQPRTAPESHATILLIDASNLAWTDLQYARQEILRFLTTLAPDEPLGLYILRSHGFQVLWEPAADQDSIAAQFRHWMPTAQDLSRAQDQEQRNRQHMDWVLHLTDLAYVNGNDGTDPESSYSGKQKVATASATVDPQLRTMGSNPQRDALENLRGIARHLAAFPGHKSLVLLSSDNALADWSGQAAGREDKGHNFIDSLWLHTREDLNEAHVSIYPLDASQLEAGVVTADLENRLIKSKLPPKPGDPPPPPPNPTGRYAAQMHQDTHPIQPEFRELAEATGGRALPRAGDIAAELNGITNDGRAACLLSFTPDQPADDKYHLLTIKLVGHRDLTLRYRTGYLYEKDPATLKERFQQAVWQSRDLTDIALTATPKGAGKERGLTLNIAASDLAMAQAGERWTDMLQVFLIESDDPTVHAKFTGRRLGLRLQPATYERVLRQGIVVDAPLPAQSAPGSLRIVVVDENSGRMGSLTIPAWVAAGETP